MVAREKQEATVGQCGFVLYLYLWWFGTYTGDRFIFIFYFWSLSVVFRGVFVFVLPCRNNAAFAAKVV